MKKLAGFAAFALTVIVASAFQSRSVSSDNSSFMAYEQSDTVPGKKKGDTAKHRYPKRDTTATFISTVGR